MISALFDFSFHAFRSVFVMNGLEEYFSFKPM